MGPQACGAGHIYNSQLIFFLPLSSLSDCIFQAISFSWFCDQNRLYDNATRLHQGKPNFLFFTLITVILILFLFFFSFFGLCAYQFCEEIFPTQLLNQLASVSNFKVFLLCIFMQTHCKGNPNFNFHKYMVRALEADFKRVVGIRSVIIINLQKSPHGYIVSLVATYLAITCKKSLISQLPITLNYQLYINSLTMICRWYLWFFVVIFLLLNVSGKLPAITFVNQALIFQILIIQLKIFNRGVILTTLIFHISANVNTCRSSQQHAPRSLNHNHT